MKSFIVFLTFAVLTSSLSYANPVNNGQPGCLTEEELIVKYYRHFQNKTVYWECVALGEPAVLQTCPVAHGFLDPAKECVHFSLWYWTPTVAPPSVPATEAPVEA
ncbi:uncharacterized protein ACRADG_003578 [Cochliomyia hominivorax]